MNSGIAQFALNFLQDMGQDFTKFKNPVSHLVEFLSLYILKVSCNKISSTTDDLECVPYIHLYDQVVLHNIIAVTKSIIMTVATSTSTVYNYLSYVLETRVTEHFCQHQRFYVLKNNSLAAGVNMSSSPASIFISVANGFIMQSF